MVDRFILQMLSSSRFRNFKIRSSVLATIWSCLGVLGSRNRRALGFSNCPITHHIDATGSFYCIYPTVLYAMTADAMVLIEGEYGVSPDFEWRSGKCDFFVRYSLC